MKGVRIWLIVLLAALLPVRGAVAAAMLCPVAGVGAQLEMQFAHHEASVHDAMDFAQQHHDGDHHDHGAGGPSDSKCNLCSAFCSLTPLVSTNAIVLPPLDAVNTSFPAFSAPAPRFFSEGPERPPRTI